jgi:hypothetical protein
MLVPKITLSRMLMLMGTISSNRSTGSPRAIRAGHRSICMVTTSVIVLTKPSSRWRWNTGKISRRRRCQGSPSLMNKPSPMIRLNPLRMRSFQ